MFQISNSWYHLTFTERDINNKLSYNSIITASWFLKVNEHILSTCKYLYVGILYIGIIKRKGKIYSNISDTNIDLYVR